MPHETPASPDEFFRLVHAKLRHFRLTRHATLKSEKLFLPENAVKADLFGERPLAVFEQPSDEAHERKFNAYYAQMAGLFHRYVLTLNNEIRLITVIRTSKDLQKRFKR